MKVKKAIIILEEQKQKVLDSNYPNNDEWIVQTASYIKNFFGFESTEYSRIAQFKWYVRTDNLTSNDEVKRLLKEKKENIIIFLDNCQKTLKNKGLYKIEQKNILSQKDNIFIFSTAIAILLFGFAVGYWIREFEVFSTLNKNIETSQSAFDQKKTTDSIPN